MANYVVLGAAGGIGEATCRQLRDAGHQVFLAGRDEGKLSALAGSLDAPYQTVNATNVADVEALVEAAAEQLGSLDGLVNSVGSVLLKPAHLTTPDEWMQTINTNLTSAFATVRAGFKVLKKQGGSIVLMSSSAARVGLASHEAIAAAKAGVVGLMQSAAASYAGRGIRINAVAPGLVKTGLTERIWSNEKSAQVSCAMHPLGRLGEPSEIASLITWLLDPANNWITGQVIGVDGGLATLRPAR